MFSNINIYLDKINNYFNIYDAYVKIEQFDNGIKIIITNKNNLFYKYKYIPYSIFSNMNLDQVLYKLTNNIINNK